MTSHDPICVPVPAPSMRGILIGRAARQHFPHHHRQTTVHSPQPPLAHSQPFFHLEHPLELSEPSSADTSEDEAYGHDQLCDLPFRRGDAVRDTLNGGHLIILDVLGQGAYAVVYRARDTRSGRLFALKCLSKRGLSWEQLTLQREEAKLHKSLGVHPNIVHLHRYFENKDWLFLVLEYCPGQDLYCWVTEHRDEADANGRPRSAIEQRRVVKDVFAQVLEAVSYCHQRGVFHRDLKPENFIVCADGVVKLTDFGLATTEKASDEFDCGSQPYMSHECRVPLTKTYSPRQADIWSLGVLLLALLYRRTPWPYADPESCSQFRQFLVHPDSYLRDVFGCEPGLTAFLTRRVFCPVEQGRVGVAEWLRMWYDDLVLPTSDSARRRFANGRTTQTGSLDLKKKKIPFTPPRSVANNVPVQSRLVQQPRQQSPVSRPLPSLAARLAAHLKSADTMKSSELARSAPVSSLLAPPKDASDRSLRRKHSWSDLVDDDEKMDFSAPLVFDDDNGDNNHDQDNAERSPKPIVLSTKSSADSGFVSSADVSPTASYDDDQDRLDSKVPETIAVPISMPIPIRPTGASRTAPPSRRMTSDKMGKDRYASGFTEDELLFAMDRLGW